MRIFHTLSVFVSVCLSGCPFVCVLLCVSVCLSVHPSITLSVYLSTNLSLYQSVRLSVYPSIYLSFCPSIYQSIICLPLSIYLSIDLSIYLSISTSLYSPSIFLSMQMSQIIHSQAGQLASQRHRSQDLQQSLQDELAVSQQRIAFQEREILGLKKYVILYSRLVRFFVSDSRA